MSNAQVKKSSSNTWDQYKAKTFSNLQLVFQNKTLWVINASQDIKDAIEKLVATVTCEICKTAHEKGENSIRDKKDLLTYKLKYQGDTYSAIAMEIYHDTYARISPERYNLSGNIYEPSVKEHGDRRHLKFCIEVSWVFIIIEYSLQALDDNGDPIKSYDLYENFKPESVYVSSNGNDRDYTTVISEIETFDTGIAYLAQGVYTDLFETE